MLVLGGAKTVGRATLRSTLVFTRPLWLNAIHREGLRLDTRFVPGAKGPPRPGACVFLLLEGTFSIDGPEHVRFEAPSAFVVSEDLVDGAHGVRRRTFRTEGTTFAAIELHFFDGRGPVATDVPRLLPLEERAWTAAAARLLARAAEAGDEAHDELQGALSEILRALAGASLVDARVVADVRAPVPFERLLRAARPLAKQFALSATLDELGAFGETSTRQLDRWVRAFFRTFPVVGGSWRALTVHLRLRLAVVFLSAEGTSISEVASAVGYGSTEAMSRAFRDAGLPAPSVVRDAVLGAHGRPDGAERILSADALGRFAGARARGQE